MKMTMLLMATLLTELEPDAEKFAEGSLCLWCGAPKTMTCDAPLSPYAEDMATCDAPMCGGCAAFSMTVAGDDGCTGSINCCRYCAKHPYSLDSVISETEHRERVARSATSPVALAGDPA